MSSSIDTSNSNKNTQKVTKQIQPNLSSNLLPNIDVIPKHPIPQHHTHAPKQKQHSSTASLPLHPLFHPLPSKSPLPLPLPFPLSFPPSPSPSPSTPSPSPSPSPSLSPSPSPSPSRRSLLLLPASMTQPPPSASFRGPPPVFTLNNTQRQVLTRKLATLLLKPLSADPFRTIVLSGCSFGDAAANVAGPLLLTLARKQCLHTVILSDVLASLTADEALRSLSSLASSIGIYKRLCAVDLSHNAVGTMGMAACAPLLQSQPHLQVVNLEDTGLSADAARLLREYLLASTTSSSSFSVPKTDNNTTDTNDNSTNNNNDNNNSNNSNANETSTSSVSSSSTTDVLPPSSSSVSSSTTTTTTTKGKTTQLRGLNVHANRLDSDGLFHIAAVVQKSPFLQCLRTSSIGAGVAAMKALASALESSVSDLRELDISDNSFDDDVAACLARALAKQPRLARLVLCDLNMSDTALQLIVDAVLESRAPLTELRLSGNELTARSAHHLVRLLTATHSQVAVLDISANELGNEGVAVIAHTIGNVGKCALMKLSVADNDLSSYAVVNLAHRVLEHGISQLDFTHNENVPTAVAKRIAAVFAPTVVVLDEEEEDDEGEEEDDDDEGEDEGEEEKEKGEVEVQDTGIENGAVEADKKTSSVTRRRRRRRMPSEIENALQALENTARSERDTTQNGAAASVTTTTNNTEPASPQSQSEVSRLVQFFSTDDEKRLRRTDTTTTTTTDEKDEQSEQLQVTETTTDRITENENEPGTPPPSRFIGGITSPITPPPSTSRIDTTDNNEINAEQTETEVDEEQEEEEGSVILSARKLKESIVSLSKEISDVAGELEMPLTLGNNNNNENGNIGVARRIDNDNDNDNDINIDHDDNNMDRRRLLSQKSQINSNSASNDLTRNKPSFATLVFDCIGGCLVALFVVIIVLAIAQSQEEATFSFRPI